MDVDILSKSDEELGSEGHVVICGEKRPSRPGFSASVLFHLLQGSGPFSGSDQRDTTDDAWSDITPARREQLLRLERWAQLVPGIPVGRALRAAGDKRLLVLDQENDRIILLAAGAKEP